jgi:hypothetical protein
MRSSLPSRILPLLQTLAEGGWIAVVYAAAQALFDHPPHIGPIELAMLAGIGMAWGRRTRWRDAATEAIGLPILALAGGALGWFLDPHVRDAVVSGNLSAALGMHFGGWLAGIAVIRGAAHGDPDDDEVVQERLLRWGIPGLAIPWLIGQALAPVGARQLFTDAAFIGTMVFAGSAFAAMGLARLEAVRVATGSDWRRNRTWLATLGVVAVAVMVIGIPTASLLGVPLRALIAMVYGPIRVLVIAFLVLMTPVLLLAAVVAEALHKIIPRGNYLPTITLPDFSKLPVTPENVAPTVIFYALVGVLILFELVIVGMIIYLRWQERRRIARALAQGFEERSIVIPDAAELPAAAPAPASRPRRRRYAADDPAGAYLAALEALASDGRWPRLPHETPAVHARRTRGEGLADPSLSRLAAAYQLVRYAGRTLAHQEAGRAPLRLRRLLQTLRTRG